MRQLLRVLTNLVDDVFIVVDVALKVQYWFSVIHRVVDC